MQAPTSSTQITEYAIVCISPFPSPISNDLRNEITMTQPMSPGIQRPCFLPLDPPFKCQLPYTSNSLLPPSTFNLPPLNILPPPLQLSTLPPSYENQMLPPSNVTTPFPPYNDPLPLSTMLINTSFIPLPPSLSAIPLTHSLPHITRHRMSESMALKRITFRNYPNVPSRYAGSGRQGPQSLACLASGAMS